MIDLLKIYQYALQREKEGRDFFRNNAGRFRLAAVVDAFERLAAEEERHIRFIEGLINALETDGVSGIETGEAMEREGLFSMRAEAELLDQTVIEAMVPDLAVLRMAYRIERDLAALYDTASGETQDETARKSLMMLAKWEHQHERLLKSMHDKASEELASMPWGR